MIRMLIIDDEYYIRLGIVHAFNWAEMNIEIVGDAADGEEGLQLHQKNNSCSFVPA